MTWLRTWWRETPTLVRNWTTVLLPTGVILFVLGLIGDQKGFWEDRSFLTNLVSSLTALMFGVPLALHFLGRLGAAQETAAATRDWRRWAARAASDLEAEVITVLSCTSVQAATAAVAHAQSATSAVIQKLNIAPEQVPPEAVIDAFCDTAATYLEAFAKSSGVIRQRWQTVERLVSQGHELEQSWISAKDLAGMNQKLDVLSKLDDPRFRPDQLRRRLARLRSRQQQPQPSGLATLAQNPRAHVNDLRRCAGDSAFGLKVLAELLGALPQPPS
ncbi:hypothetical protein ACFU6S_44220 [Streptomyces sp. NPDC057456]|uniref:hypothetical protein n=1 Tax=Streptomyces sp. NPDC057456 TaxID=3346139 RepID=UPI00367AB8D6